jgi:hypothetical protein
MMRPAEQFSAWRDELIAEATALADELAAARETLANAERDERVERAPGWLSMGSCAAQLANTGPSRQPVSRRPKG